MDAQQEALHRAVSSPSMANYGAIFAGFTAKGIAEQDIIPRQNVFTFEAWRALGRQVKKGEHGVAVCTWVPMTKRDENGEAQPIGRKPRTSTVFHVSQTEPRAGYSEGLWKYALSHGTTEKAGDDIAQGEAMQPEVKHETPKPRVNAASDYYSTEFTPIAKG